jgi:cobalamin-dependent methionine synthase I
MRFIDLGVLWCQTEEIFASCKKRESVDIIGLSGLITPSLDENGWSLQKEMK